MAEGPASSGNGSLGAHKNTASVTFTNALKSYHNSLPCVSGCGNYFAYIVQVHDGQHKIIVRSTLSHDHPIVYEKNLTRLYEEHIVEPNIVRLRQKKDQNKLEEFLEVNYIKGTFKVVNDYKSQIKGAESTLSRSSSLSQRKQQSQSLESSFKLQWEPLLSSNRCCKILVFEEVLNAIYVLNITNQASLLVIKNDLQKDYKIAKVSWIGDLLDTNKNSSGANFLAIFYEMNLNFRIFQLSPTRLVSEINKPKFPRSWRRSTHFIDFKEEDKTTNGSFFTVVAKTSANDIIHNFKVVKENYTQKSVIPISSFQTANSIHKLLWSWTGKWLCVIDSNLEMSLYNLFGLGGGAASKLAKNAGKALLRLNLSEHGLQGVSKVKWGIISSDNLGKHNVDNNYAILENNNEIIMVCDLSGDIHIYDVNSGLRPFQVLKHCPTIRFGNKDDLFIWGQQEGPAGIYHFTKVTRFDVRGGLLSLTDSPADSTSVGEVGLIAVELEEKIRNISLLRSSKSLALKYCDFLCKQHNIIATTLLSVPNAVYIWDINQKKVSNGQIGTSLVTVIRTSYSVKSASWHPLFSSLLMIVTEFHIILWSYHWDGKPITLSPTFDAKPTVTTLSTQNNSTKTKPSASLISQARWISKNVSPESDLEGTDTFQSELEILCQATNNKFTIIRYKLSLSQLQNQIRFFDKFIESPVVQNTFLTLSTSDQDVFKHHTLRYEQGSHNEEKEDTISQILIDDDTEAMNLINGAIQQEWANEAQGEQRNENNLALAKIRRLDAYSVEEDTFKFKKKKV